MDRGTNLEALTEEEDEQSYESDNSQEDSKEDGGIRRGEPNKFDSLCDGVLGTLALVHGSLQELLEVKDELLKSSLPPNVLTKISLASTKIFRSVGDMHMPINELIRMVRIYSTPWEEKSAALKKLHEDYEAKKSQLNIAIKRLQMVDGQSRRMSRDRRIMHWEKLFCRITSARGHGRRWKFLIDSFKKKAKEGIPALQQYLDTMENVSDSEDDEVDMDYMDTQMQHLEPSEELDPETDEDGESELESSESESKISAETPVESEVEKVQMFIKPPTRDKQVSTSDPTFDRFLYVRVYKPEGLDHRELKCSFTCGKETYKTGILDIVDNGDEKEIKPAVEEDISEAKEMPDNNSVPTKKGRGRGLIGSRGSRGSQSSDVKTPSPKPDEQKNVKYDGRYEEMLFTMPEKEPYGVWKRKKSASKGPEHLRVAVQHGPSNEMLAMATIDLSDLDSLDLPSVILPQHPDTADVLHQSDFALDSDLEMSDDESSKEAVNSETNQSVAGSKFNLPTKYKGVDPINFPLYSLETGKSDSMHLPCGQLPLVCFWAKRLQPKAFHKTTDADTLTDIVYDLTGINLEEVTKEELHPETTERALSAMSTTPEPKEETVPRSDYNRLMKTHQEEMEILQEEYEQRLQDLAESIQHMQVLNFEESPHRPPSSIARSKSMTNSTIPSYREENVPHPPREAKNTNENSQKPRRTGKSLPNWGENLPKNFFERLRWFEEMNNKHRRELSEKTNKEISENYERKLAGEFKLREAGDDDTDYNPLQDVSLPAVFMPSKGRDLTIFNPRASKYFHATGSGSLRLTQPPSMVQLPPLPKSKVSVVNLFDVSNNFRRGGNEWLLQRYMQQQQNSEKSQPRPTHQVPPSGVEEEQQGELYMQDAVPGIHQQNMMGKEASAICSSGHSRLKEAMME